MACLGRVVVLVVDHQNVRTWLLVAYNYLSEIDGSCYCDCPSMIEAHSIDILVTANSEKVLGTRLIGEKAHALIPSVSKCGFRAYDKFIFCKMVKNIFEEVHASISPKTSIFVHQLMTKQVCNRSKFAIGWFSRLLISQKSLHDVIRNWEILSSYVFCSPQNHFIVRMETFRFIPEVFFSVGHLTSKPCLMDDFGDKFRSFFLSHRNILFSLVEDKLFAERYSP